MTEAIAEPRRKFCYVGAPKIFLLEQACQPIWSSFCVHPKNSGVYLVGSCLERPDWRDVDVRCMLDDEAFSALFPDVHLDLSAAVWEFDPRWLLLTTSIAAWLSKASKLPVDFQFQPANFANELHKGRRQPIGLRYSSPA